MNRFLRRAALFFVTAALLAPWVSSGAQDDSFIWAFRYKDQVGVHYGRIRLSLAAGQKVDTESPFYLEALFRPGYFLNPDGSALFESKNGYKKPDLSRYDFFRPYSDPEPKTRLGVRVVSFDGVTLTADLEEIIYGSSVRRVKLRAAPNGDLYGICEGSYLRGYKIGAGSVETTLADKKEWRSRGIRGTEYWLLVQRNGQRIYPNQRAVVDALEAGASRRQEESALLSAAETAELLVQAHYKSVNRWYQRRREPQGTVVEPGSGDFKKFEDQIREAMESGKPVQGEDLIIQTVITDRQWSKEIPPPPTGAFARGIDKLIGVFSRGELVSEETVVSNGKILQVGRDSGCRVVRSPLALPQRTGGAGRTPAEALSGAIQEAGREISSHVRSEKADVEKSSSQGQVASRGVSSNAQAVKGYKVTKIEKVQDSSGERYECEIEYVPGIVVPK